MRVAFNGRFSGTNRPTGTQTVAFWIFESVLRKKRDFEVFVFVDTSTDKRIQNWNNYPGVRIIHVPFRSWGKIRCNAWEQIVFPTLARNLNCDLIHNPINTCPRYCRGISNIVTVHDLNFLHHPEWYGFTFRRWLVHWILPAIKKAESVVCVSDYVQKDVTKTLKLNSRNVHRIYNGVKSSIVSEEVTATHGSYVLTVNPWQPHKNLRRVIEAMKLIWGKRPELDLVIVGRAQENFGKGENLREHLDDPRIRVLDYVSEEELKILYSEAALLCYPSLEEGFGLPILESLISGAPVVTSNLSCLPEIGGSSCQYVDPFSAISIAEGIQVLLNEDSVSRNSRIEKGLVHAKKFNWSLVAEQYIELYKQCVS